MIMRQPDSELQLFSASFPCREYQLRQLSKLYSTHHAAPPVCVIYGPQATGKTTVAKEALRSSNCPFSVVDSRECITGRHLLERALATTIEALDGTYGGSAGRRQQNRCESVSALNVHLQQLLSGRNRFVLVFDGIDGQREMSPTLPSALARLHESISNLSVVFIVSHPRPRFLHLPGIPHINFPQYSKEEAIHILSRNPPSIFIAPPDPSLEYTEELAADDNQWVWTRFLAAVWESAARSAARDVVRFRAVAERLWRPFVAPIVDGSFGTRDFSRLLVHRRALFQDEGKLLEKIVPQAIDDKSKLSLKCEHVAMNFLFMAKIYQVHDLPYFSKYILCAAYLASYNPARQDQTYFMKSSEKKRRKRGGMVGSGRVQKNRKISRTLLSPSPFTVDRLLAILHAIVPHDIPKTADVFVQISNLAALRLLLKSGVIGGDILDPGCKWRVNYGLEYTSTLGRSVGFELSEYLAGTAE